MKNVGGVQADWGFKMPNDSEIELETWADHGEPNAEKLLKKKSSIRKFSQLSQEKAH